MDTNGLQQLIDKYPYKKHRIERWETDLRLCELMADIKEHGAMKKLLEDAESIVLSIDTKLLSFSKMTEMERECLLTDKERCLWFLSYFNGYEVKAKNIKANLNKL